MKRTFLAIPIAVGTEYPALVGKLQKNLQHEQRNINWCKTNQIHLTLKFVGDTPDSDIPTIIEACQKVAQRHQTFSMDFNRTGIFGSNHSPRVLWLGMQDEPKALYELEEDILDAFDSVGYLRDRQNFVPHLTICRIKQLVDKALFQQIYQKIEQKTYLHADVNEIVYYQSFLQPTGAFYKALKRIPLGK
ncbi:MAG: RNA 2',3'-cyclic phosphodiesterase [Bacteroidales bacterium]|nr:RNA 2',3'-cyclic phosphodiesterase [Bacteroidales bacterium]